MRHSFSCRQNRYIYFQTQSFFRLGSKVLSAPFGHKQVYQRLLKQSQVRHRNEPYENVGFLCLFSSLAGSLPARKKEKLNPVQATSQLLSRFGGLPPQPVCGKDAVLSNKKEPLERRGRKTVQGEASLPACVTAVTARLRQHRNSSPDPQPGGIKKGHTRRITPQPGSAAVSAVVRRDRELSPHCTVLTLIFFIRSALTKQRQERAAVIKNPPVTGFSAARQTVISEKSGGNSSVCQRANCAY